MPDAGEGGFETVVVALGDGVEFVVVAAGAVGGEAEEGLGDDADHLFELIFAYGFPLLFHGGG